LDDVRKQMAGLYWDARRGTLPTQDASRLCFVLSHIARVIEGGEIERRLVALEEAHLRQEGDAVDREQADDVDREDE
jgi:hypothetical protein